MISNDGYAIVRQRQLAIRRELDRRGVALKAVSFDSGLSYQTLLSYFPAEGSREPAAIPMAAVFNLCGAIPGDLLNLLLPEGWAIVQVPSGIDFDEISGACRDFIDAKDRSHHPDSEAGRDIGPNEQQELSNKVVSIRARAA
jgi:hypothetical protein